MSSLPRWAPALGALFCGVTGFVVGRNWVSGAPDSANHDEGSDLVIATEYLPAVVRGPAAVGTRLATAVSLDSADGGVPPPSLPSAFEGHEVRAVNALAAALSVRGTRTDIFRDPEEGANAFSQYLEGWTGAIANADPASMGAVAAEVARRLCRPGRNDVETLVYLRFGLRVAPDSPEIRDGVRCVLAERTEEDVLVRAALDAWRAGDFGEAEEIERWRANATDERTLRRLPARSASHSVTTPHE